MKSTLTMKRLSTAGIMFFSINGCIWIGFALACRWFV